jgi:hypothetical protein
MANLPPSVHLPPTTAHEKNTNRPDSVIKDNRAISPPDTGRQVRDRAEAALLRDGGPLRQESVQHAPGHRNRVRCVRDHHLPDRQETGAHRDEVCGPV